MNNPNDPGQGYPPQGPHSPQNPYPPQGPYPPVPGAPHMPPPGYPDVPGGHAGWAPPPRVSGGRTGLIIAIVFLVLLIVAGATLYFTGMLERWFGGAPTTAAATAPAVGTTPVATPRAPVTAAPRPITVPANGIYLVGTWGPNCPGSRSDSATLNSDGTVTGESGSGTWTIDSGSTVTATVNGVTRQAYWEMQADGSALVRPSDGRSPTLVRRC